MRGALNTSAAEHSALCLAFPLVGNPEAREHEQPPLGRECE